MAGTTTAETAAVERGGPPHPVLVKIRDLIYKVAGIYQPDDKLCFIEEKISRRMRARAIRDFSDYFESLTAKPERDAELRELLNEITDGETCLFRSLPQMDALRNSILPELTQVKSHMSQRKLRVWCAGCSTGEEAYTLAMVLADEIASKYPGWTFELTATDLNERSLAAAKEGIYGDYALRQTPDHFRDKYFLAAQGQFQVKPEVKSRVSFSHLNLADERKMLFMKGMNLISCCNVLIYFDANSRRRAVQHFFSNLLAGGYLLLGEAESLYTFQNEFRLVHFTQATAYFKPSHSSVPMVKL